MKILESLSLEEVKNILRQVRTYADMKKKLGQRGAELFDRTYHKTHTYVVEYFPILGEENAWEQAKHIFQKSFECTPDRKEVRFISREDIKGGMKVYFDDKMVDMSYTKVEKLLRK